jgi:hypothetical protein
MAKNVREIMKKIEEKNLILKSLSHKDNSNEEKIRHEKIELDSLLYQYLKSLRCSGTAIC